MKSFEINDLRLLTLDFRPLTFVPFVFLLTVDRGLATVDN
jgi:hypothetical protein